MALHDERGDASDEDEFCVVLDARGRAFGATTRGADADYYGTTARADFVRVNDALRRACEDIDAHGAVWIGASDVPRCGVERLARAVFERYAEGCEYDAATSGAEFWTRRGSSPGGHFDKDEDARERFGVWVAPHLATVTYVGGGRGAAPTVVFEGLTPKSRPEAENRDEGTCARTAVMYPRVGSHLKFDGRFLHGVYEEMAESTECEDERLTFLVNIWFNHRPVGVVRLPDAMTDDLEPELGESPKEIDPAVLCPACLDVTPMCESSFGPTKTEYKLVGSTALPITALQACAASGMPFIVMEHRDGDSIRIEAGTSDDEPASKRARAD